MPISPVSMVMVSRSSGLAVMLAKSWLGEEGEEGGREGGRGGGREGGREAGRERGRIYTYVWLCVCDNVGIFEVVEDITREEGKEYG